MSHRKQWILCPPDQLYRDLQLVQSLGRVVVASKEGLRTDQGPNRGEVGVVVTLCGVELPEVVQVCVIHRSLEVMARSRKAARHAPDHLRWRPMQCIAGHTNHRLTHARDRDQAG